MGNMMLRQVYEATTLSASEEKLADGNSDAVRLQTMVNAHVFTFDLTAAATDVQDLLDVYVQTLLDGTNWTDVVHFTTCLGNGGALRYIEKIETGTSEAGFEVGAALAAGTVRHLFGDAWRVRWDITESGPASGSGTGLAAFTFSVISCPE
jgi:hypothetical protein